MFGILVVSPERLKQYCQLIQFKPIKKIKKPYSVQTYLWHRFETKKQTHSYTQRKRWTWQLWISYLSHGRRQLRSASIIFIIIIIIILVITNYILFLILITSLFPLLSLLQPNQTTRLRGSLKCQPTYQNQVLFLISHSIFDILAFFFYYLYMFSYTLENRDHNKCKSILCFMNLK